MSIVQAPSTDRHQQVVLRRATHGLWSSLPALSVGSVTVTLCLGVAFVLGGGLTPWGLLLGAVLTGAPVAALAGVCSDIVLHDEATIRDWAARLRRTGRRGIELLLVPAVPAALLMVASVVHDRSRAAIWLVPMAVSAIATVVTAFALVAAIPAAIARPDLKGLALWGTALHLCARWPLRFLAPLSVLGLGTWAGLTITGTLLILVPGPVLLLAAAAFWSSAVELGATDLSSENPSDERTPTS